MSRINHSALEQWKRKEHGNETGSRTRVNDGIDLTFEYFLETARYTLAEPVKQNEEAEVLRTFMKYMMVRFKLIPIELGWNSLAAGLGAETFFGQYRKHRMLRPAIAFALNSKNWRAPITKLSPAANRFFRYEQTQVPSGLWMLRELPPPLFATLMVPKLIKQGRLNSFEAQVCGWVKGSLKDEETKKTRAVGLRG